MPRYLEGILSKVGVGVLNVQGRGRVGVLKIQYLFLHKNNNNDIEDASTSASDIPTSNDNQQMFTDQPIHHQPMSQQASYPPPQYSPSYAHAMSHAIQPTVNVVLNQPTCKDPSFQNSKF